MSSSSHDDERPARPGHAGGVGYVAAPTAPARTVRELLPWAAGAAKMDAMTPELRQRIAAASRIRIFGALLPTLR